MRKTCALASKCYSGTRAGSLACASCCSGAAPSPVLHAVHQHLDDEASTQLPNPHTKLLVRLGCVTATTAATAASLTCCARCSFLQGNSAGSRHISCLACVARTYKTDESKSLGCSTTGQMLLPELLSRLLMLWLIDWMRVALCGATLHAVTSALTEGNV
jgi:hypothetical protein